MRVTVVGICSVSRRRAVRVQALDHGERRDLTAVDAMKSASMSSKFIPVMTASSALDESDVAIGRPRVESALVSSSRPPSIASSRRSRWNHWRIFDLARDDWRSRASRVTDRGVALAGHDLDHVGERRTYRGARATLTLAPSSVADSVCTA